MWCITTTIIKAASEQAEIISVLAKEIWEQHYTPIIGASQVEYMLNNLQNFEKIENEITIGDMVYYIVYYNECPVCYCAVKPEYRQIFLSKLYVKKDYRNLGIGKKMIKHIIDRFEGKEYIYLTVNKQNINSINAYKNMGFVIVDSVVNEIGNGYFMDDYVMRLLLIYKAAD